MGRRGLVAPRLLAATLCVSLAGLASARAQGIDLSGGGPVQVTAQGGFEWREAQQEVVATGDARAVRGNVTVLADQLTAFYRKKAGSSSPGSSSPGSSSPGSSSPGSEAPGSGAPGSGAPAGGAPAATPASATQAAAADKPADAGGALGSIDNGDTEVYRLAADGHVRIVTPTDEALADHAIYDIDQAVLVLTGQHLRLTTPQQVMTARDSMEYWSQKHMAVGRGDAVVVTNDGRRISADTLVGYTDPAPAAGTSAAAPVPASAPAPSAGAAAAPSGSSLGAGKLKRVEAFGNVEVRTITDTVRGDRGVYLPDTGMARIVGHVRITHGQNQLNGPAADVNMQTGIAHIVSAPGKRVEGLIMPNDAKATTGASTGASAPARAGAGRAATP